MEDNTELKKVLSQPNRLKPGERRSLFSRELDETVREDGSYYAFHLCCFFVRVHLWPRLLLGIAPCELPSARAGLVAAQANIFLKPVFFGFLRLPFEFLPKRSSQGRTIFSSCRYVSGYGLLSCRCIATAKLLVVAEKKYFFLLYFLELVLM